MFSLSVDRRDKAAALVEKLCSLEQKLFDKEDRCVRSVISIALLRETVTLILPKDVPDGNSLLCRRYKLCDVGDGNARIVLTMNDQQRLLNLLRVIERCDPFHEFLHFR